MRTVYRAKLVFLSCGTPPEDELEGSDVNLTSNFQIRSIVQDVNKTGIKKLEGASGNYLLVDFFEERFPVAQARGTTVTLSSEYLNSGLEYSDKIVWRKLSETISGTTFLERFDQFTSKISELYPEERIILHQAYLCNEYISRDGSISQFPSDVVAWNNSINSKLHALYSRFKNNLPRCHSINLCRHFVGSENNKWGLASTHYQEEYYEHVAKALCHIILRKPLLPLYCMTAKIAQLKRD